jgi:RNA polymerase sigma-70 factor, ECF subfamily
VKSERFSEPLRCRLETQGMKPASADNRDQHDPDHRSDDLTDQQLVASLNGGDVTAFEQLYFRHRDWVLRLAQRFTGHHDDAQDVVQETFAYFIRKFPGFQLTASLTTFFYPAVKHLSMTARRKRLRSTGGDEQLDLICETTDHNSGQRDEMSAALTSLSDAHREILLMRFVDEMTQPEIAAALDVPLGTVKSRLHHAILAAKELPEFASEREDRKRP